MLRSTRRSAISLATRYCSSRHRLPRIFTKRWDSTTTPTPCLGGATVWAQWKEEDATGNGNTCQRPIYGSLLLGNQHADATSNKQRQNLDTRHQPSHEQQISSPCNFLDAKIIGDETSAKRALHFLRQKDSNVLIYRGHYGNAKQLLTALKRRSPQKSNRQPTTVQEEWNLHRQRMRQEAWDTNRLLVEVNPQTCQLCHLSKAPVLPTALLQDVVIGGGPKVQQQRNDTEQQPPYLLPLREILARIGNNQWQTKGVFIPQLDNVIYPHFGVYPPTRQEYLDLLPLEYLQDTNKKIKTMDIGTGTGVLAAILLHHHPDLTVVATDMNPLAIACARENLQRLGFEARVQLVETTGNDDLFATLNEKEPMDLLVCNPPWIPISSSSSREDASSSSSSFLSWMDRAIYDVDHGMLYGFLEGAAGHLRDDTSEAWFILSDLAEHLHLRSQDELQQRITEGGLELVERRAAARKHVSSTKTKGRATINKRKLQEDALFPKVAAARAAETTYLYRLRKKKS